MKAFRFVSVLILCAPSLAAVGCGHEPARPNTVAAADGSGAGGMVSGETAAQTLATARCDREARCNNVGPSQKWTSIDMCRVDLVAKNRGELRPSECPNGIGQADLNKCMAEIQAEDCNSPFDTLARLAACRTGELCR